MADNRQIGNTAANTTSESDRDIGQEGSTHDPEFEMPDPEQVERDIEQAERIFGKNRLAEKPDKAA
ncbi:MAG TPA: hypothetical protein VG498_09210 [Terriglobales bacterium]|nr:hypothetical protein [Terriglobales bacterium]